MKAVPVQPARLVSELTPANGGACDSTQWHKLSPERLVSTTPSWHKVFHRN